MDEVVLDGKTYVASSEAAVECGYAQDYVGQLSRKGFIDAKRVSGKWYVQLDSLRTYKEKAEAFKPEPPKYQPDPNVEATLDVEGKEYVSAARASKLADYNQDYIAQLARAGKVPSRQVGARWYIEKDALLRHRQEKDAMLRAVQAESVGLKRPEPKYLSQSPAILTKKITEHPLMSYNSDAKPLFPEIAESVSLKAVQDAPTQVSAPTGPTSRINIRVLRPITMVAIEEQSKPAHQASGPRNAVSIPEKTMFSKLFPQIAFAAVLLIVVGLGTYKRDTISTTALGMMNTSQTSSVGHLGNNIGAVFAEMLTKELVYIRK